MQMDIEEQLSIRWQERAELLRRIEEGLLEDFRVRAAWLTGSVARGEDDALSDLDIFIVVTDDAIADFVDNRRAYASGPARSILLMDNLANAPSSGAYLLALYECQAGPQHVDWFWQAESMARRPDDGKILFDRAELPVVPGVQWRDTVIRASGPPLGPNPSLSDLLTHKIAFFWAMSFVAAKYIARRNGGMVGRLLRLVSRTLTEASTLAPSSVTTTERYDVTVTGLETASPAAQLQELRKLAGLAEVLGSQLASGGAGLPSEAVSRAYEFFDFAEAIAAQDVDLLRRSVRRYRKF